MYNPKHFEQGDLGVVSALIAHFPLGALVTTQNGNPQQGDHILDSTVLIDNFKWDAKPTTGPITDRPK